MICCAYAGRSGAEVSTNSLREHLKKLVPSYMFPVRWMSYDVLPKNSNGKIDRPRLKERFFRAELKQSATEVIQPSTAETPRRGPAATDDRTEAIGK